MKISNYKVTSSEQMYRLRLFLNIHTTKEHDNISKRSENNEIKLPKIIECGGVHFKNSQKNRQRRKEINREKEVQGGIVIEYKGYLIRKKKNETYKMRNGRGKINSEINSKKSQYKKKKNQEKS